LQRISAGAERIENADAEAHPATAHMFIVNPLHAGGIASLFSTHPPMEQRIARLEEMAADMGQQPKAGPWSEPKA
jgi:heat shock protein HtpX